MATAARRRIGSNESQALADEPGKRTLPQKRLDLVHQLVVMADREMAARSITDERGIPHVLGRVPAGFLRAE